RFAAAHAFEYPPHPAHALAAGRALAAALVLVEIGDAGDGADYVGRLVHDDDRRRAKTRLQLAHPVEIHDRGIALVRRNDRARRPAGDHGEQIVPTTPHTAGMRLDQLAERDRHRLFDGTWRVHVTGNVEELCPEIVRTPEAREPAGAAPHDLRSNCDRLDIVDRRWAAIKTHVRGERRLQPRQAF